MFGFSKTDHDTGVVVDVGSSSVGVAVVHTHPTGETEIIWEHREYCLIHSDPTPQTQLKQIKTAAMNAFLELSTQASKVLKEREINTTISAVQVLVSAPWSYTITKTITLSDKHPFPISEELIEELIESAQKQSNLVFATNEVAKTLGLELTHSDVIHILINGYSVREAVMQEGRSVALSHLQTAIASSITETIADAVNKFFPTATVSQYSFMYAFYLTMRNLRPNTAEICLIDITGEATELAIVRDDVLRHTTHIQAGMYTLARRIAAETKVTTEEAYAYLKDDPEALTERLPQKHQEAVQTVIDTYCDELSDMFLRTGDKLSTPKTIFLHTDARTEAFFIKQLETAATKATGGSYTVHPVTSKVLGMSQNADTALLLNVNFYCNKGEYMQLLPKDE